MEEIGIVESSAKEEVASPKPSTSQQPPTNYDELDTDDLYVKYKKLQQQLEFLEVQEEYIKVRGSV